VKAIEFFKGLVCKLLKQKYFQTTGLAVQLLKSERPNQHYACKAPTTKLKKRCKKIKELYFGENICVINGYI